MTSNVYTKYVKDFDGNDYELHLCKHSDARYDVYASVKNSGNKYHVIGGYVSDMDAWLDGEKWWEAFPTYMEEEHIFFDILEEESALKGLHELDFLRRTNTSFYGNLFNAISKYHDDPNGSPELKEVLRVIAEYIL